MPDFSLLALIDASLLWMGRHPLAFCAVCIALILLAGHLLVSAFERDLDRMERDAHITQAFDAAHEELAERTKGAA